MSGKFVPIFLLNWQIGIKLEFLLNLANWNSNEKSPTQKAD